MHSAQRDVEEMADVLVLQIQKQMPAEIVDVVVTPEKVNVLVPQLQEQMVTVEESALPVRDEMSEVERLLIPWRRFARSVLLHVHAGCTLTGSHVEMALETLGKPGVAESTVICD